VDPQIESVILSEIQAIGSKLQDFQARTYAWQQEAGERFAALETSMKAVVGNGQPGRLTRVEQAVAVLQRWQYRMIGAAAGGGLVVTAIAWIVTHIVR